jgi:hypothetical protein
LSYVATLGITKPFTFPLLHACAPSFTIPLRKGTFEDGMPVILKVRGMESQAVLESVLPTAVKGDKSLGNGGVDITDLCMGLKVRLDEE